MEEVFVLGNFNRSIRRFVGTPKLVTLLMGLAILMSCTRNDTSIDKKAGILARRVSSDGFTEIIYLTNKLAMLRQGKEYSLVKAEYIGEAYETSETGDNTEYLIRDISGLAIIKSDPSLIVCKGFKFSATQNPSEAVEQYICVQSTDEIRINSFLSINDCLVFIRSLNAKADVTFNKPYDLFKK
jgi:hypothetical protein